jgi:hemerythrin-like metal-binding protein
MRNREVAMALLHWQQSYSVGVEAVDHEHRELIALINRLHDEWTAKGSREEVEAFLGDLLAGISAHFALEEHIMREHRYDGLAAHKADHERLLDELRDIMDDFAAASVDDALAARLETWFARHFQTHDARLEKALSERRR